MTALRRILRRPFGRTTLAGIALVMLTGCPSGDGSGDGSTPPEATPTPVVPPTSAPAVDPAPVTDAAPDMTPPATDDAPTAGAPVGVVSSDEAFYVVYRITPDPIPLNELFSIEVEIYDASNRETRLTDLELAVDGRMPDHRHGMNREPKVVRNDDGSFTVTGMLFHMPGFWELHFDVSRVGSTERALVEIDLE